MKMIIIFISSLLFLTACSSDDIVRQENNELLGIFRNIAKEMQSRPKEKTKANRNKKDKSLALKVQPTYNSCFLTR